MLSIHFCLIQSYNGVVTQRGSSSVKTSRIQSPAGLWAD